MADSSPQDMTVLLRRVGDGDADAVEQLLPLVYDELRRIADAQFRRERSGHTMQPTALANDAFLRLIDQTRVQWQDRVHFFAVASTAIRRMLIDHARARDAQKRGGGAGQVTISLARDVATAEDIDLVALNEVLERLSELDPRKGRVVELRFFGGLTIEETAEVLSISAVADGVILIGEIEQHA